MSFKHILFILCLYLPTTLCVVGTVAMALNGVTGWGWLLFAAIIMGIKDVKFRE